jgi:aldehyde dehydrogenase (NAD+)
MTCDAEGLTNTLLIGGELIARGSAGQLKHFDPATGRINGTVTLGGRPEVEAAVQVSIEAQRTWERLGPARRRDCLGELANVIARWHDEFSALAAAEIGLPISNFPARHAAAIEWIRTYQGWADKIGGDITAASDDGRLEYTRLEPYGVVGIIITWNTALLSLAMKVTPALAGGNAVIVKPSELTPYTAILFGRACLEAGIPAGVVNIIPGGIEAGEAIVVHPHIDKISFTGGLRAATAMMRAGAAWVKPFCLELGGKSCHIVFADADLDCAVRHATVALSNAGQSCTFGSRILVHSSVHDAFRTKLEDKVRGQVIGSPLDSRTTMGPLATAQARDRVLSMIHAVVKAGEGSVVLGGRAPEFQGDLAGGYFVEPTILCDVAATSSIIQEEIFGPAFTLERFESEDEAVRRANDTAFGLSNYVYTPELMRATRVTARLKSGTVYVNNAARANAAAPFGGFKRSGIGYEGGRPGLDEFLRRKTVGLV